MKLDDQVLMQMNEKQLLIEMLKSLHMLTANFEDAISNPYKEFTLTVADGETLPIYYSFNYIRVLEISTTTDVFLRFGSSGEPTNIVGAGIGYKIPAKVDRVDVINNSGGSLQITLGLAIGEIDDSRFTASGTLTTRENVPILTTVADQSVTTTASSILASDTNRQTAYITNLNPAIGAYVGGATLNPAGGFTGNYIAPLSTFEYVTQDEIFAASTSGTVDLGISYSEVS